MRTKLAAVIAVIAMMFAFSACDIMPSGTTIYGPDVMPAPIAQNCYILGYDSATCLAYAHQVWGWYPGKP